MKRLLSPIPLSLLVLAGAASSTLHAQTPKESISFEQYPATLKEIEADVSRVLDTARTSVEQEATAKHISETVAQQLLWSLRTTASGGYDNNSLVASARVPADNATLNKSFRELEDALSRAQTKRSEAAVGTKKDLYARISQVIQRASKPEDVDPLLTAVDQLSTGLASKPSGRIGDLTNQLQGILTLLNNWKRMLAAKLSGQTIEAGRLLQSCQEMPVYDSAFPKQEINAAIDQVVQPSRKAAEQAREALDQAIKARKSPGELQALIKAYADAVDFYTSMPRQNTSDGGVSVRNTLSAYQTIVSNLADTASDELNREKLRALRGSIAQLGPQRFADYTALLNQWEREADEKEKEARKAQSEKIRTRIAAAKEPRDLEGLAADILNESREQRTTSGDNQNLTELANHLNALATAWSTNSPALLPRDQDDYYTRGVVIKELGELRLRIARDVVSRVLKLPELNAAPLNQQPVDAAIDQFCADLVTKGDWRRLYNILNARSATQLQNGRNPESDALAGLRAYFAGQNFELAEQWTDAIRCYKTVLQCTSEYVPIKPAAERLKTLTKEHPDTAASANKPAAPAAQPANE